MASGSKLKTVSKDTVLNSWSKEINDNYEFTFDAENKRVIHAVFRVCRKHYKRIEATYKGKLVQDVKSYGENGTSYILKPNLERHMSSTGHVKCKEMETGEPSCKRQKTLSSALGTAQERSKNALLPLMRCSLYVGWKEKPYNDFPDLVSLNVDNGCQMSSSFNNPRACKVFNRSIAKTMVQETKDHISNGGFYSWLIDGSSVSKNKMTYEGELLFIRTAPELRPQTSLYEFISMKDYGRVTSDHLFHALLYALCQLTGDNVECDLDQDIVDIPVDRLVEMIKNTSSKQCIGVGADGASVNFGAKKGLTVQFKKKICPWAVAIHCFAHRLELSGGDSIKNTFNDILAFNTEIYQHFKNSPTEWMLLNSISSKMNIILLQFPKPYGTRFAAHLTGFLQAIRFNWLPLALHFINTKEESQNKEQAAKAVGYLTNLLSFRFLARCHILEDILKIQSTASKALQCEDTKSISDAHRDIHSTLGKLDDLVLNKGQLEKKLIKQLTAAKAVKRNEEIHLGAATRKTTRQAQQPQTSTSAETESDTQKSVTFKVKVPLSLGKSQEDTEPVENSDDENDGDQNKQVKYSKFLIQDYKEPLIMKDFISIEQMNEIRDTALHDFKKSIEERFYVLEKESHILDKCKFLDIETWPNDNSLTNYANEDVEYLFDHFEVPLQTCDTSEIDVVVDQFKDLKSFYGPEICKQNYKSSTFWSMVYRSKRQRFSSILRLVEILLCIPFSTAVVERGFSSLRRIMSDWRALLGHNLITDCLHFSTRKNILKSATYREKLAQSAADAFLTAQDKGSDDAGGLSKRRINLLAKHIEPKLDLVSPTIELDDGESDDEMS